MDASIECTIKLELIKHKVREIWTTLDENLLLKEIKVSETCIQTMHLREKCQLYERELNIQLIAFQKKLTR